MDTLAAWIAQQYRRSAAGMLLSVSCSVVKTRPGFGQRIVPRPGSIVASPVPGAYDPDPDYFFHWYRDSAVIVDALRLLHTDEALGASVRRHFADFVRFSLELGTLDGRRLVDAPAWREPVQESFRQYLRPDTELATVHGAAVPAETRVNPDGTLDISRWGRPQHDGPALRALAVMRWLRDVPLEATTAEAAAALLRADLDWVLAHGRAPCIDIWEEEHGLHYYTLRVAAAALEAGAGWLENAASGPAVPRATSAPGAQAAAAAGATGSGPDRELAAACRAGAGTVLQALDNYWLDAEGYYRSRILEGGVRSTRELDIAVILAAVHTWEDGGGAMPRPDTGTHRIRDPRLHATLARLEALFDTLYPINHQRPAGRGTAMGRYRDDRYYSGGAYYFSTLGAAEFCYRAAAARADAGPADPALLARGDAFLETVRAYTPASGELSEQFDQRTGAQTSARQLAWSHAAFLTCVEARRLAVAA